MVNGTFVAGINKELKVCLVYSEFKVQERKVWLMHFQVKMPQNGGENIFIDMQTTNKVPLIFLEIKVLTER